MQPISAVCRGRSPGSGSGCCFPGPDGLRTPVPRARADGHGGHV